MRQLAITSLAIATIVTAQLHPELEDTSAARGIGNNGDQYRSFKQIVTRAGFAFEEHEVVTEDGYILAVYRIPGKLGTEDPFQDVDIEIELANDEVDKPAVLFQHGILDSANAWIMHYSDLSPAFIAAEAGYDVWLNNSRGNTFSRRHVRWSPDHDKNEFWAFDWQEMGKYDMPAVIDYILDKKEKQTQVAFIGHSQGTTQMYYALAAEVPGLKEKLSLFVALGSVTKISNAFSVYYKRSLDAYWIIDHTFKLFNVQEIFNNSWRMPLGTKVCTWFPFVCNIFYESTINLYPEKNDADRFNVYSFGHFPHGSPVRSWRHYCQNAKSDRFQLYIDDYSKNNNISDEIDLTKISDVPIAIFGGADDELADRTDASWTKDQIGDNVVHYELIEGGHLSFIVGKDMGYFTKSVMNLLAEYHPMPSADLFTPEL